MRILAALLALSLTAAARAGEVQLAVAANFTAPMKQIAADFERDTGHRLRLTYGATGKFYAQIKHGAPFDVLLAADAVTPAKLVAEGAAIGASLRTYAIGRLVLWSATPGLVDAKGAVLARGSFPHLAIANPALAPYGAAAIEVMASMNTLKAIEPRLVRADSIAQAHQFVASGAAQLGFVALSQVYENGKLTSGSAWIVPSRLHAPIRQDAVVLARGARNRAAAALLAYLAAPGAQAVIRAYGYELEGGHAQRR